MSVPLITRKGPRRQAQLSAFLEHRLSEGRLLQERGIEDPLGGEVVVGAGHHAGRDRLPAGGPRRDASRSKSAGVFPSCATRSCLMTPRLGTGEPGTGMR